MVSDIDSKINKILIKLSNEKKELALSHQHSFLSSQIYSPEPKQYEVSLNKTSHLAIPIMNHNFNLIKTQSKSFMNKQQNSENTSFDSSG